MPENERTVIVWNLARAIRLPLALILIVAAATMLGDYFTSLGPVGFSEASFLSPLIVFAVLLVGCAIAIPAALAVSLHEAYKLTLSQTGVESCYLALTHHYEWGKLLKVTPPDAFGTVGINTMPRHGPRKPPAEPEKSWYYQDYVEEYDWEGVSEEQLQALVAHPACPGSLKDTVPSVMLSRPNPVHN